MIAPVRLRVFDLSKVRKRYEISLVLPVSPAHERCTPVHLYGTRVIGLLDTILPPKNLSNRIVEAEANLASSRRVKAPPLDGMESTRERDPPVDARLDPAAGWGQKCPRSEMAPIEREELEVQGDFSGDGAEEPCSSGGNPEDRDPNFSVWSVTPPVLVDIMGVRSADSLECGRGYAQNIPVVLVARASV